MIVFSGYTSLIFPVFVIYHLIYDVANNSQVFTVDSSAKRVPKFPNIEPCYHPLMYYA